MVGAAGNCTPFGDTDRVAVWKRIALPPSGPAHEKRTTKERTAEHLDDENGTLPPEEPSQHMPRAVPFPKQPMSIIPADIIIQSIPEDYNSALHLKTIRLRRIAIIYLAL
ncbi:hypothetical protein NDU88_000206 [Pleurodeles waltl]|uniref:Uncharacterized protein n=1 Tax=Pleurodeles waltl TaxID=8319 RepID=A0AAV7UQ44_PLEWA|nr:hypothetical protein NDU88_000206 [Pleurodeles waltl]